MATVIWDAVRFAVDKRGLMGQFILTGSARPADDETSHSGTGRITGMLMRPMSLFESKESNGNVSLKRLFIGETEIGAKSTLTIEQIANAIRKSHKRQFVDPSISTAAMRTNAQGILRDFETFGFLFESLCTRDLRVYAQANDGGIFHYRDKSELESDLVIKLHDGRWAAVEVKLGLQQIDKAAANLLKLSEKVNQEKMNQPSFLMVVTGGQVAYRRPDGVLVVPIGCLRD